LVLRHEDGCRLLDRKGKNVGFSYCRAQENYEANTQETGGESAVHQYEY
jgi:hypothetical protein